MAKAKTYQYVPGDNPFTERGNEGYLITNIDLGFAKVAGTDVTGEPFDGSKHEIYWPRPLVASHDSMESLSDECKSFWGDQADLQTIIDAGIAQLMTRPNYKAAASDKETEEEKHAAAQDYATNYEVGRRATTGPGVKKKATAYDALQKEAEELGLTMDQILEIARNNAA